jgi:hypothetical protein
MADVKDAAGERHVRERDLGVMMAILIPVAVGGGVYVLLASFVQRSPSRRVPAAARVPPRVD